jgi:hypothetical protein
MEQGLRKFITGRITRRPELATADLSIRKLQAVEALSRYGKADVGLLASITVQPNLWPTSAVLDWWSVLSRMTSVPDRARRLAEAEQIVRSRLNMQGTVMRFSTEATDSLWWLMVSPDVNAVRLVLLLTRTGQWQQDVPRLMSGALARQRRGAWGLTLANAWGVLAVEKFSAAYEKTAVTGTTTAVLAPVAVQARGSRGRPQGNGQALGHAPGPRGHPVARAAVEWLHHQSDRHRRGAEAAGRVDAGRHRARPSRGRRAERHDLGRDQ